MKTARTYQRRTARLPSSVTLAALLCGASPALAGPSLGAAENFAVLDTTTAATGVIASKSERSDYGNFSFSEDGVIASVPEFASMLLFVGGLISMFGFMGVSRRATDHFED